MASPQPKIKSKVRCVDGEVGEIVHVIADPLSLDVSHIVVRANGTERQVPVSAIGAIRGESVELTCNAAQFSGFPELKRQDYVSSKEVEIPHLENRIHVEPGELLVPFPELEKNCARRSFFAGFINVIGALIGLPLVWPVLRFVMKPMYVPYDNHWIKIGNISKIRTDDVGVQYIFKKSFKDSVLQREEDKNHWVIKASPETLKKIYPHGDIPFMMKRARSSGSTSRPSPTLSSPASAHTSDAATSGGRTKHAARSFCVRVILASTMPQGRCWTGRPRVLWTCSRSRSPRPGTSRLSMSNTRRGGKSRSALPR